MSAGTNGEVVQWQAFFFDPTTNVVSPTRRASGAPTASEPGRPPAPATPLINNSLVGLINERRNRNEEKIQRNLRSRNPSEPTLRRVGNEAPRGDGRVGGVDVFEMDYRVRYVVTGLFVARCRLTGGWRRREAVVGCGAFVASCCRGRSGEMWCAQCFTTCLVAAGCLDTEMSLASHRRNRVPIRDAKQCTIFTGLVSGMSPGWCGLTAVM